jgi:hypothetical protein
MKTRISIAVSHREQYSEIFKFSATFFICHRLEAWKKGIYCYRFTHCGVPVVVFDAAVVSFK